MNDRERFIACMEYQPADRRPHHEPGVLPDTRARWERENPEAVGAFAWNWFEGEGALGLDRREFVPVDFGLVPPSEPAPPAERDASAPPPIRTPEDVAGLRRRLGAAATGRHPGDLDVRIEGWLRRDCSLRLGRSCAIHGFCRQARQLMGAVNLSLDAGDEHAGLIHEVMAFWADFLIETSRPVLEKIHVDFVVLHEDPVLKGGPLLDPATYREFVFPNLKRLVDFFREYGTRYVAVDAAGDPTALIPILMEAGVDTLMPVDRAADTGPHEWRRRFGPSLRLWGAVDPRVLPLGPDAVRAHLREFIPLIEEGGFIPMVDRLVPPDVSWDQFRSYVDLKRELLCGNFAALGA